MFILLTDFKYENVIPPKKSEIRRQAPAQVHQDKEWRRKNKPFWVQDYKLVSVDNSPNIFLPD